jgi:molecular chaperone GrpE
MEEQEGKQLTEDKEILKEKKESKKEIPKKTQIVKELKKKLSEKEKEVSELNDKYLRLAADFDNYRKRAEKEIGEIITYAGEEVIKKILPILDDIERAINNGENNKNKDSLNEGLKLIYKKFTKVLNELGVEQIEAIGGAFNPGLHHAIMTREEEGIKPDIVIEEFEKGYKLKDRVIRYAKVVVSK